MTDFEVRISSRQLVLQARDAFVKGMVFGFDVARQPSASAEFVGLARLREHAAKEAAMRYPLPEADE